MEPERAVAALVVDIGEERRFVAPALLLRRGPTVVALVADLPPDTSLDLLRVVVTHDGASSVEPLERWSTETGHLVLVLSRAVWNGEIVPLSAGLLSELRENTDASVVALGIIPKGRGFRTVRIGVRLYEKQHRSASPRFEDSSSYHAIARDDIPEGTLRRGAAVVAVHAPSRVLGRAAEIHVMGLACQSGLVIQASLDSAVRPIPARDAPDQVSPTAPVVEMPERRIEQPRGPTSDHFAWIAQVLARIGEASVLVRWLGDARPGHPIIPGTLHIDHPRPLGPTSFMLDLCADDTIESITAIHASGAPTLADAVFAFGTARSIGGRSAMELYEMEQAQLSDARFELTVHCVGPQQHCYMVTLRRRR